jgi:hypothetical protein
VWANVGNNRRCALTKRASARNPSVEANISDFEILSAFRLTQNVYLLAKMRHITADGFSQGPRMNCSPAPAGFGCRLANQKLSDSPRSYAQPVDCRRARRFMVGPSITRRRRMSCSCALAGGSPGRGVAEPGALTSCCTGGVFSQPGVTGAWKKAEGGAFSADRKGNAMDESL